jgi:hypothetical protein
MPDAHEPPETASGWEFDEGVTKKLPPEDRSEESAEDPIEEAVDALEESPDLVLEELSDPEEPWAAASPAKAAVAVAARTATVRVIRFTRRRLRSRWSMALVFMPPSRPPAPERRLRAR